MDALAIMCPFDYPEIHETTRCPEKLHPIDNDDGDTEGIPTYLSRCQLLSGPCHYPTNTHPDTWEIFSQIDL